MKKRLNCLILAGLSLGIAACKPMSSEPTGYIIGPSNDIETLDASDRQEVSEKHLKSVSVLAVAPSVNRRKYCTGVLVGPASPGENLRMLTNRHCQAEESGALYSDPCGMTKMYFGFIKGETKSREVRTCKPGTYRADPMGDLAVLTLDQNPSDRFSPASFYTGNINEHRKASIIHYPNLDSQTNTEGMLIFEPTAGIPLPVAQFTTKNCESLGPFPRGEWHLGTQLPWGLRHTCDLIKGSSGSALWDDATDTILGINWGGVKLTYQKSKSETTYNVATMAPYVLAFLEDRLEAQQKSILGTGGLSGSDDALAGTKPKSKGKKGGSFGCSTLASSDVEDFVTPPLAFLLPLAFVYRLRRRKVATDT